MMTILSRLQGRENGNYETGSRESGKTGEARNYRSGESRIRETTQPNLDARRETERVRHKGYRAHRCDTWGGECLPGGHRPAVARGGQGLDQRTRTRRGRIRGAEDY